MFFNYLDFKTYRDFPIVQIKAGAFEQPYILAGWIEAVRTHATLVFFELKDKTAILQCIVSQQQAHFAQAQQLKQGDVVRVEGRLVARAQRYVTDSPLGDRELHVTSLVSLSHAHVPYEAQDGPHELTRMTHRYFDLRDPRQAYLLKVRSEVIKCVHQFFTTHDFTYVETPILMQSTPEGARDFLVFSRQQVGHAYALPQSPQLFKQMLMIGQVDKYYQLARCFRDEDFRANRQPEFTQIDVEMAFVNAGDVKAIILALVSTIAAQVFQLHLAPVPEITYAEAIRLYGNDAPDLSIAELTFIELGQVLPTALQPALAMKFHRPDVSLQLLHTLTTECLNTLALFGFIIVKDEESTVHGNMTIKPDMLTQIRLACASLPGDIIFFGADPQVSKSFSALRKVLAKEFQLQRPGIWPVWVVDFPMFMLNREQQLEVLHHPFTCPDITCLSDLTAKTLELKSHTYDLVINGEECCGGSLRTIDVAVLQQVFQLLGHSEAQIQARFGFFLQALATGTPPHGGFAIGLERLIMVFAAEPNIRNIITFPKTQSGTCLLTGAPSPVSSHQMQELGLTLSTPDKLASS